MMTLFLNYFSVAIALACFISTTNAADDTTPVELSELLKQTDKIEVFQSPREKTKVLFSTVERKDFDELSKALQVKHPKEYLHCMCDGTPAIVLYQGEKVLATITNHHGVFVRCSLWHSDAALVDSEPLLKWFDARKIPEPRLEVELAIRLAKQGDENERKWLAAMPSALKPYWGKINYIPEVPEKTLKQMQRDLAKQIEKQEDHIKALFAWYGSGAGPWSGFSAYEDVPENMLFLYSTPELLTAIEGQELSTAEIEGVARFFGGWDFSQKRAEDDKLLSAKLKAKLWEHTRKTTDEDKLSRAKQAFESK
jgi:hypothetical protein